MTTTRRTLLRSGIIGACIAVAAEIAANTVWGQTEVNGAAPYAAFVELFFVPCLWLINWLVDVGIIQKHDGISVVAVFIVYTALIGAILGVAIGLLICSARNRWGGDRTDKRELQRISAEGTQEKTGGNRPAKRSKWPRLLLSHVLASYLTMLVLSVVLFFAAAYRNHPDESGPIIYKLILAPIFVPYIMVLSFADYMGSVTTWGFSIGGPSATLIASWACYIGFSALGYFLLRRYTKGKRQGQQT